MLSLQVFILLSCCTFCLLKGVSKCNHSLLVSKCKNLFKRNHQFECRSETLQLFPKCLYMASECKAHASIRETDKVQSSKANFSQVHDALMKKFHMYRSCFLRRRVRSCNESRIKECYKDFDRNSTEICRHVHSLRLCVLLLPPMGCHEMRNPWYTVAYGIIKKHKSCFIQNYTAVLGVLNRRKNNSITEGKLKSNGNFSTAVTPISCITNPSLQASKWSIGYKLVVAIFVCLLIIASVAILFICIKRSAISSKTRRGLMTMRTRNEATDLNLLDVRETRTCVSSNGGTLSYVINELEAPPPYSSNETGFLMGNMDSPPPYTSRPTSVNGDFV